ncbi:MAG: UbiA family prenyltransferase [Pirellulales bacterium]
MSLSETPPSSPRPIFVDMDGTLIATDLGQEALFQALKNDPRVLVRLPFWLRHGLASTKARLAERVILNPTDLPYHHTVLAALKELKAAGHPLILATASDRSWAAPVAAHLNLFDDVLASDGTVNLKGPHKLAAIEAYCQARLERVRILGRFPRRSADLGRTDVRPGGRGQSGRKVAGALRNEARPQRVFAERGSRLRGLVKALRPKQWIKNILVFAPLILSHRWAETEKVWASVAAFVAFSLCASSVYIFNDVFDAAADRAHPTKRKRPFASGVLPLTWGPAIIAGLLCLAGVTIAVGVPASAAPYFVAILGVYGVLNVWYSLRGKKRMVVDVLALAAMYTLRVLAAGAAAEIEVSEWFLALSMFLFASLAFAKRYAELAALPPDIERPAGRGYSSLDLPIIANCGLTAGYLAVLVLALYINNPVMGTLYKNAFALWLICPLLLYWITRLWFIAHRGQLDEDPIIYAFRDRISLTVGALVVACALAATYWDRIESWWR